ncbi:MAG TPA: acyl-CoA dehydrogenase family protein [Pseudonocardiaceae bacterium]|nr:acyl-CoA dehydrogenase family protein [Pseudonocardiaceae bacterium]
MDFALSPVQRMLRDNARAHLENICPPGHVRAMETDPAGYSRDLVAGLGERGWLGVTAATDVGGLGLSPIELSVLAQEIGRALLPGPILSTAVAGTLIAAALPDVTDLSRDIVAGRVLVADALFDSADARVSDVGTRATPTDGGYRLVGEKRFVQYGRSANLLAVLATRPTTLDTPDSGVSVHLVPVDAPGIRTTELRSTGGEPLYQVVLDGVEVDAGDSIAPGPGTDELVRRITELSRLTTAAQLVGMSRKLFDTCLAHAKARRQFGRAIGTFQVIQHQLVDLYAEVERAQVLLDQAAWLMAEGSDHERELALARSAASDTSYLASHTAGHIYGGYGFMNINDVQLYYRRSKVLELRFGTADACRAEIAKLGYLSAFELPDSDQRTIPDLSMFGSV